MGNKFDLNAARKHADTGGLMNTTKWLHAALDEIERLRSKPAWEVTEERIEAIASVLEGEFCPACDDCCVLPSDDAAGVLRTMLDEVRRE